MLGCCLIAGNIFVTHFRIPGQTGMKPPTISVDPAGQEAQPSAPVEPRPHVVTGPFKIDTSKYVWCYKTYCL